MLVFLTQLEVRWWGQVVHMDIKPANILLQDRTCRVAKIADLGVSRYLVEGSLSTITSRGAPRLLQLCCYQCPFLRRRCGLTGRPCGRPSCSVWVRAPAVWAAGTLNYMAPELLEYQTGKLPHPQAVDIYRCGALPMFRRSDLSSAELRAALHACSFGVVLREVASGKAPVLRTMQPLRYVSWHLPSRS